MSNIERILNLVPEIDVFLTPDEMDESTFALQKKFPHLLQVDKVGESREHHPLYRLKIGSGKKKALMYGCPHPNEPIGCMMLEHLSRILCENEALLNELDTTFYIIKAIDPDGLKLNEGWLKGPFTYENYASHFYRPISDAQVEWTFPLHYKNYHFDKYLPETKVLMDQMEEIIPDFVYSLHNSSFGGVYFYVNKPDHNIIDHLPEAANHADLPLNLGEPECIFSEVYAPAVYEFLRGTQYYDYYEENLPGNPADLMVCGGSSGDYMSNINPNAFVMMCEEPYFYCPDSSNLSPCDDMTRKEAILKSYEVRDEVVSKLRELNETLRKYAPLQSPYIRALEMYTAEYGHEKEAQIKLMNDHPEEYSDMATVASKFDNLIGSGWYPLLAFGMIIGSAKQVLENTSLNNEQIAELHGLIKESENFIHERCIEIEKSIPCKPIDIQKLVKVQMESALIVLENLNISK